MRRGARSWRRVALALAVLAGLALLGREGLPDLRAPAPPERAAAPDVAGERSVGAARLHALFREGRSGVWVEAEGTVVAVLPDDRRGSRHQRLILHTGADHTVLLSHNIDLAPRIASVAEGDRVAFRGRYEWNPEGGVVHWTHEDPERRRPGGWVRHEGRTYR